MIMCKLSNDDGHNKTEAQRGDNMILCSYNERVRECLIGCKSKFENKCVDSQYLNEV